MVDYDLFKEIENYTSRHLESSKEFYLKRNQNQSRMFENILRGKIGEWCCYFSMKNAGYILEQPPDMKIYSDTNKTYDADLICIGKKDLIYNQPQHIHIKSISKKSLELYGTSFLVQKNDSIVTNPDPNHFYSIMLEDSLTHYKFHRWLNCCDANYIPPNIAHLASTKLAVRLD